MCTILQTQPPANLAGRSNSDGGLGSLLIAICLVVLAIVMSMYVESWVLRWRANKDASTVEMGVVSRIELVDAHEHQDTQVSTNLHMFYLDGLATLRSGEVLGFVGGRWNLGIGAPLKRNSES